MYLPRKWIVFSHLILLANFSSTYTKSISVDCKLLVIKGTTYFYRPKGATLGLDLTAFNIQRGRDHGLPTYAKMLAFLGQSLPSNFDQLIPLIPSQVRINVNISSYS